MPKYRYVKTGKVYEVVHSMAKLQCSTAPSVEDRFKDKFFIVYKWVGNKDLFFVRPAEEFLDGRFERVDE